MCWPTLLFGVVKQAVKNVWLKNLDKGLWKRHWKYQNIVNP